MAETDNLLTSATPSASVWWRNAVVRNYQRWPWYLVCGAILLFLIIPTVLVIPMSFSASSYLRFPPEGLSLKWYLAYFSDSDWMGATAFSLKLAVLTMVAAVIIGTAASIALIHGQVPGKGLFGALILGPMIVPHIIVAIAVYLQFAPWRLNGTMLGFVLIHTVLSVPYVVLIVSAALRRHDFSLEMASLSLGATRWHTFWQVTMPLVRPAVAAGAVFAFISSFDESVVSLFISGEVNKTITRKFFEDLDFNVSPIIAAVSTIFVVVSVGLMSFSEYLKGGDKPAGQNSEP